MLSTLRTYSGPSDSWNLNTWCLLGILILNSHYFGAGCSGGGQGVAPILTSCIGMNLHSHTCVGRFQMSDHPVAGTWHVSLVLAMMQAYR
jgi:hypothetical protein